LVGEADFLLGEVWINSFQIFDDSGDLGRVLSESDDDGLLLKSLGIIALLRIKGHDKHIAMIIGDETEVYVG